MSKFSRSKGQRGERSVAALIYDLMGWDVRRRVRNDKGDSDLVGAPGWSIEVKDHAKATLGDVRDWWMQCVMQSVNGEIPLLVYKRQRAEWRFVYPVCVHLETQDAVWWKHHDWTVETSPEGWATVAREIHGNH